MDESIWNDLKVLEVEDTNAFNVTDKKDPSANHNQYNRSHIDLNKTQMQLDISSPDYIGTSGKKTTVTRRKIDSEGAKKQQRKSKKGKRPTNYFQSPYFL